MFALELGLSLVSAPLIQLGAVNTLTSGLEQEPLSSCTTYLGSEELLQQNLLSLLVVIAGLVGKPVVCRKARPLESNPKRRRRWNSQAA